MIPGCHIGIGYKVTVTVKSNVTFIDSIKRGMVLAVPEMEQRRAFPSGGEMKKKGERI